MKKKIVKLLAALCIVTMLLPLASCNFPIGSLRTVTSSLKEHGYEIKRLIPVALIPESLLEQPNTNPNVNVEIDWETMEWVVIASSQQQDLIIFIFKDDVSAKSFWEQTPAAIFGIDKNHTCTSVSDRTTGTTVCPYCEAADGFRVEKSENTIRVSGSDEEDVNDTNFISIVREGNIVYIEA